jgi:regulator of nucleoside diphosphate kinase
MILNEKDYNRLIAQIKQLRLSALGSSNIKAFAEMLKDAEVIKSDKTPPDLITMNSKVLLKRMDNNQELELSVVYHDDADTRSKKVSVFAPLGMSLLGLKEKETVNCQLPVGNIHYHVTKIMYQPESAGDLHL